MQHFISDWGYPDTPDRKGDLRTPLVPRIEGPQTCALLAGHKGPHQMTERCGILIRTRTCPRAKGHHGRHLNFEAFQRAQSSKAERRFCSGADGSRGYALSDPYWSHGIGGLMRASAFLWFFGPIAALRSSGPTCSSPRRPICRCRVGCDEGQQQSPIAIPTHHCATAESEAS